MRSEKKKLELTVLSNKEEVQFLESEKRRAEEEAVEAKLKYAQVSMDKDLFQMKFGKLVKEMKKRGIEI